MVLRLFPPMVVMTNHCIWLKIYAMQFFKKFKISNSQTPNILSV